MGEGKAVIIGAGPAGLTAALELQRQTGLQPVILEASQALGGIARTVCYKGNRMDIGGHRFFSKSERVMDWWQEQMPLADAGDGPGDLVMLERQRQSRIYFLRSFFDYPIRFTVATVRNMGLRRTLGCGLSYLHALLWPKRQERSLEDFLINRFGRQLYLTFFKSYTEKVWGVPCAEISAEWGAQRIKGLSLIGILRHFCQRSFARPGHSLAQKEIETSLIERFLYPKLGPGQLWEHVADQVRAGGGAIHMGMTVDRICTEAGRVVAVEAVDAAGRRMRFAGEYFLSTMPVRDLLKAMEEVTPAEVRAVGEGLQYRDFITVGLLSKALAVREQDGSAVRDNWIYIQEPDVMVGRLQIFNNWSPYLVAEPEKSWLGLEYFCQEGDALWRKSDAEMAQMAVEEMVRIGMLRAGDVEDYHVVRMAKCYPAYFGSYAHFGRIRAFVDGFENLFLIGRNGMHKYNNQDHSMLTAMTAVENIARGQSCKDNIWAINTECEYLEEKKKTDARAPVSAPV